MKHPTLNLAKPIGRRRSRTAAPLLRRPSSQRCRPPGIRAMGTGHTKTHQVIHDGHVPTPYEDSPAAPQHLRQTPRHAPTSSPGPYNGPCSPLWLPCGAQGPTGEGPRRYRCISTTSSTWPRRRHRRRRSSIAPPIKSSAEYMFGNLFPMTPSPTPNSRSSISSHRARPTRDVAQQLHFSPYTVKTHLHNAFAKLGTTSSSPIGAQLMRGAEWPVRQISRY